MHARGRLPSAVAAMSLRAVELNPTAAKPATSRRFARVSIRAGGYSRRRLPLPRAAAFAITRDQNTLPLLAGTPPRHVLDLSPPGLAASHHGIRALAGTPPRSFLEDVAKHSARR
eukprot:CAMPEP_0174902562 /NCGR_PEP_ID=MMETSP0167-20121228/38497_1 /TAXON_ID=38298 /ORGANISM="Rhodella maculata, Strain CCMP736" /LENGTH=114 /DNA_ID=CAMNT_0016144617 /DNA_START=354 /DNA_END=695 /DNA_ORIENTATION=-